MKPDSEHLLSYMPTVIYGAPLPFPDFEKELAACFGLTFPCELTAMSPAVTTGLTVIPIHEGVQIFVREPEPEADANQWVHCPDAHYLRHGIQRAIVARRRRELDELGEDRKPLLPEDEFRWVQLAVRHLRDVPESPETAALAQTVTALIVRGHVHSLNTIRRKLLELLHQVTYKAAAVTALNQVWHRAVCLILEGYSLSEFMAQFPAHLLEVATLSRQVRTAHSLEGHSELVKQALTVIVQQCASPISLREIARDLRVTPVHLARRVKAETDRTVVAHLQVHRIELAKELLVSTDDPLKVISGNCGFASLEHFQRTFRELAEMPPGQYRKQHR